MIGRVATSGDSHVGLAQEPFILFPSVSRKLIAETSLHGVQDLHHQMPVGGREIAEEVMLECQLDLGSNQASTGGEEDGRIGLGRLDHRLTTFLGPDFKIVIASCRGGGCM